MKSFLSSKFFILPLAALAFLIMFSFGKELSKKENLQKDLNLLEDEMSDIQKKKITLELDQKNLQNPAYVEREGRERFNFKKPQEELFLILDKTTGEFKEQQSLNTQKVKNYEIGPNKSSANQEKSNIMQWWEYFMR